MEFVKDCNTYSQSNRRHGDTVEEHRSLNILATRNIEDSVTRGYLSKREWLRIMSWLDDVHSSYFVGESAGNKSNETEPPTERKFPKHTNNKGETRPRIPRRWDVKEPQKRENHSGERKNHIGWDANVTYYRGSSFKELKYNKICVTGLNRGLKTDDVAGIFEGSGKIAFIDHQISVGYDGRRHAFITFVHNYSVQKAIKDMNGIKVRGCTINVTVAQ